MQGADRGNKSYEKCVQIPTGGDLAEELKRLRKLKGLTGERLGLRVGMSQSKISKIENRRLSISKEEARRILEALEVDTETVQQLTRLAEHTSSCTGKIANGSGHYSQQKSEAIIYRHFHPMIIPSILQTVRYTRSLGLPSSTQSDRGRSAWLRRLTLLHDPDRFFIIILTEAAARNRVLDDFNFLIQIEKLISYARIPNIRLGIIPDGTEASIGLVNGFRVHDETMVAIDTFTKEIHLNDQRDVDYYLNTFEALSAIAVFDAEMHEILSNVAEEYRRRYARTISRRSPESSGSRANGAPSL